MKQGDFTELAKHYSTRPDYSKSILKSILGLLDKPLSSIKFVDIGAGTGIWTRMVAEKEVNDVTAIEPNDEMRLVGEHDSIGYPIKWMKGSAEQTNLINNSVDWVTMASSFHWTDFKQSTHEFHRILKNKGIFTAIWNTRLLEMNPLLLEIENHIKLLKPNIIRVSSGSSGITKDLTERFYRSNLFEDIVYMEGRHNIKMSTERYIKIWKSVNDLHVQLGDDKFNKFLEFIQTKLEKVEYINTTYLTRAWSARKK